MYVVTPGDKSGKVTLYHAAMISCQLSSEMTGLIPAHYPIENSIEINDSSSIDGVSPVVIDHG